MKKIINTQNAPAAIGPYVQGVDLGNLLFLSGQLPINAETGEMPESIEEQAKESLANVLAILKEAGCNASNIVKTTIFLADLNDFNTVNKIYEDFFKENQADFPARSCFQVAKLPKEAKIEIEVIAAR